MPTIFWFLRMLVVLAVIAYAAMAALVWAVHPRQTEFSEPIAIDVPERPAADAAANVGAVQPAATPAQ